MLVHADRDDLVEFAFARDLAVIRDAAFEAAGEPACTARSRASSARGRLSVRPTPEIP
jgi:hypothetical protein